MTIWDLSGLTPAQREITQQAIDAADYPWERLGRTIPVEWVDLSRYSAASAAQGHAHIRREGDVGHVLQARSRALGLAWYSGKVSIDSSLESDPVLAREVFLAEGAHMVDFFAMTPEQRQAIFDAYHPHVASGTDPHGHGWFEESGNQDYWSWVGESFMFGFIHAFAPGMPTSLDAFHHPSTLEIGQKVRRILLPVVGSPRGRIYHRETCRYGRGRPVVDVEGRRPCRRCRP